MRIKLVGTRTDATEIVSGDTAWAAVTSGDIDGEANILSSKFAIGTIKDDYLGVISS